VSPESPTVSPPVIRPKVYLAAVEAYDTHAVRQGILRGLEHVGGTVRGNAVGIVDWTDASSVATAACTRPEVVEGALDVLLGRESDLFFVLTGRSAPGRCTRRVARAGHGRGMRRGFLEIPRRHPGRVTVRPADEARRYRYQLSVGARTPPARRGDPDLPLDARRDDRIPLGWELYHADTVVAFPKLAGDARAGLAGAVASLASLGRESATYSAHAARSVADAAEPCWPDLVITDAVEIGWGGARRTQAGRPLRALIVANDALAHDVVAAQLLGIDPRDCEPLRMLAARGYGSLDPASVDVAGDVGLDLLRDRVLGFGPPAPGLSRAVAAFEEATGIPPSVIIRSGVADDDPSAGLVAERFAASCDDPDAREALKRWPPTVICVGAGPGHDDGVHHFVGDAAIAAFHRENPTARSLLRLPAHLPWEGPSEIMRWTRPDGGRGIALLLPGNPPTALALQRSLFLGSLGRIRSPWGRFATAVAHAVEALGSMIRRAVRNRQGAPVVHSRKILRLRSRPWRVRWGTPAALALRPDLLPSPPPRLDAPGGSPTVPRSHEPDPEP